MYHRAGTSHIPHRQGHVIDAFEFNHFPGSLAVPAARDKNWMRARWALRLRLRNGGRWLA